MPYCELSSNNVWCWRADCEILIHDGKAETIINNRDFFFDSNMIHKAKSKSLQCFPKRYFAADVDRSKCLHATSSNAPFCTQYVDDVNYCNSITVMFPYDIEFIWLF